MVVYIKSFKDFSLVASHTIYEWELIDGKDGDSDGTVKILSTDAIDRMHEYLGQWCIINGAVYYISATTPDSDLLELTVTNPENAFSRPIALTTHEDYQNYEDMIIYSLSTAYKQGFCLGEDDMDPKYAMPYLEFEQGEGQTEFTPEVDEHGLSNLADVMNKARSEGVRIIFSPTGNRSEHLLISVWKENQKEAIVIMGDGHNFLDEEAYEDTRVEKVTVFQDMGDYEDTYIFYRDANGEISGGTDATPPVNRGEGTWEIAECNDEDDPMDAAKEIFDSGEESHKISFFSDKDLYLYQPIKLKLRGHIYSSKITRVTLSSSTHLCLYEAGEMQVTLTDKASKSASNGVLEL